MNVLVTGARGFVGRNLVQVLRLRGDVALDEYDLGSSEQELADALGRADVLFHLAGVNRPPSPEEYEAGNAGFTQEICDRLLAAGRAPKIVFASSTQADLDNPYGRSKLRAEECLRRYADAAEARVTIFRWTNLFGKWCRPNYNSVTATFCHNTAHGLPIQISDPGKEIELAYIDDVVAALLAELVGQGANLPAAEAGVGSQESGDRRRETGVRSTEYGVRSTGSGQSDIANLKSEIINHRSEIPPDPPRVTIVGVQPTYRTTLGALAAAIQSFRDSRTDLRLPELSDRFTRCLYATYLSHLPKDEFAYPLDIKRDARGELAEFVKSPHSGQIFVSRTRPGITRGNHFHHTKTEKFLVLEGEAAIRFRHVESDEVLAYRVSGKDFRVLDIPPGYTHSIENVGPNDMVVLFWASEIFDPAAPDTFAAKVLDE